MDTIYFKPGAELTFNSVVGIRSKLYKALVEASQSQSELKRQITAQDLLIRHRATPSPQFREKENHNESCLEEENSRFCLDLSDVRHCDSAGLALLIEARKLCKKYNKVFEIIGMPAETQSLAEFCGVRGILGTHTI